MKSINLLYMSLSYNLENNTLKWFKSYLQDRTQNVQIGSSTSEPVTL